MKYTVTVVKVAASGTTVLSEQVQLDPGQVAQYVRDLTGALRQPGYSVSVVANPAAR